MPKATITNEPKDITSKFRDINEGDRVFSTEHGFTAKIRTLRRVASPGVICVDISGSWVDDKTGKAKVLDETYFVLQHHEITVRAETATDLLADIEAGQIMMAKRVDLAAATYLAAQAIPTATPRS